MSRAIVSDDYREEQKLLQADTHIQSMADDVRKGLANGQLKLSDISHEHSEGGGPFGTPRHEFMGMCTKRYVSLCEAAGEVPKHRTIGAVATAVLTLATKEG